MAISKEKQKRVNAIMAKVNKKFGDNSINQLSEVAKDLEVQFHKTPSYELNAMLGGGFCRNRIVELYGQSGCGKTSLLLEQIARDQKEDPDYTVAWLETEGSLDPEDCAMFGVDMDRFTFLAQEGDISAEECMDILRALISSGEYSAICLNSVN